MRFPFSFKNGVDRKPIPLFGDSVKQFSWEPHQMLRGRNPPQLPIFGHYWDSSPVRALEASLTEEILRSVSEIVAMVMYHALG